MSTTETRDHPDREDRDPMETTETTAIHTRWQAKSEIVTAIQVTEENGSDVLRFCGIPEVPGLAATIKALPGPGGNRMPVKLRTYDWIVKHADRVNGDHFTVHGWKAFAAAYESADPLADPMFGRVYLEVQAVLDKALGTEEEDGAEGGLAADVWLLAHQRDEARAQIAEMTARLADLPEPAVAPASVTTDWCIAWGGEDANDCAGRLEYDDEAEAREMTQWIDGGIVARQTVIRLPWVNVPGEVIVLPAWAELTDLDKGAALVHLSKRENEGGDYATENYPARYFDHPVLVSLGDEDACRFAVSMDAAASTLSPEECERLCDLALAADDKRWAAEQGDAPAHASEGITGMQWDNLGHGGAA